MTITISESYVNWRLAQLASLPFEARYVISGTADEYVLAEELLENVDALKFIVRRPDSEIMLDTAQRDSLEDLFAYIDAQSGDALSGEDRDEMAAIIRNSELWKMLRSKAAAALTAFGLSANMTVEEIDELTV